MFATNATGVKVWTATYTPFGGVHTSTGALPTARFPGQWFQSESGLHQNWMRDYDPTTGRYLQADPLGLVDGASVYGYVRQNPVRWTDLTGENPLALVPAIIEFIFGGAAIGGGSANATGVVIIGGGLIVGAATPTSDGTSPPGSIPVELGQCGPADDCTIVRDQCIDHCTAKWLANTKGPVTRRSNKFSRCVAQCLHDHNCGGVNHRPWFNYYP